MQTDANLEQTLAKLQRLPEQRVAEVVDFIDFLSSRENDSALRNAAQNVTEGTLKKVWENPADAEYDKL